VVQGPAPIRTIDRALDLLVQVVDSGEVGLAEAARGCGLPASTALRLLRSLEHHEMVRRDHDGAFRPGRRLVTLAVASLRQENVLALAGPHLDALTEATGESAYLATAGPGDTAVYLRSCDSPRPIRHVGWVGHSVALQGSAIGAALTGTVGKDGYVALRGGIEPDVTAVAAPVQVAGMTVAGLSILGPSYRISDDDVRRFGTAVAQYARQLSEELGSPRASLPAPTATGGRLRSADDGPAVMTEDAS
jgi:IclR family acetate operon transcriptional repressor